MRVELKAFALLVLFMVSGVQVMTQDLTEEQRKVLEQQQETHEFQAETGRLMDILINSLYTQKEIFLRELISNAADALDKIRFLSVKNPEILGSNTELAIRIEINTEEKTVSVTDSGIGMTKNDLISNLGTIAKSGTTQFIEAIKGGNVNLIGQFGVGFYSCFLAGQKVSVASKNSDDEQYIWESQAAHSFAVSKDPRGDTLGRGTQVTIHLKQDAVEFAEESTIKELIKKYSEFINFPIYLKVTREVTKQVEDDTEQPPADEPTTDDDEVKVKDDEDDDADTKKKATKTIKEKVSEWVQVNENKAIWLRPKEEISDDDYQKFYKALSKNSGEDPFNWVHFKAEGEVEFTSLIYIPKRAPSDMFDNYYGKQTTNLKLYVRRVLISEEFEDILPRYLSFVRGVIDSDELPLNVNRETLQQLKMLKVISRKIVKKILELFQDAASVDEDDEEDDTEEGEEDDSMAETTPEEQQRLKDEKKKKKVDDYNEFWKEYGKNIKLGVIEDSSNRQKLAELTRWYSSKNATDLTSFDDYIERAKPGQDSIYYLAGENKEQLMASPIIQGLLKKGYEVLLLDDPVDEFTFQHLNEYKQKKLVNVGKGDFKQPEDNDEQRKRQKALKKVFQPLTDWWRKLLSETVDSVIISQRLVEDPIIVVSSESGYSANMERISKAQAYSSKGGNAQQFGKKIVEINPNHQAIQELLQRVKDDPDQETEEMARVLYEAALVNSGILEFYLGYSIPNPEKFATRFYKLFNSALGIDRDAPIKDFEVEIEQEPETEATVDDDGTKWEKVNTDDAQWETVNDDKRDDL
uniref:Heat shock protein 92 n=1 Tax=Paramecium caudatum TaxID=5885 RepID=Q08L88_PARCA|nr:heat shock protein 92 [Paramecium caudatum]